MLVERAIAATRRSSACAITSSSYERRLLISSSREPSERRNAARYSWGISVMRSGMLKGVKSLIPLRDPRDCKWLSKRTNERPCWAQF